MRFHRPIPQTSPQRRERLRRRPQAALAAQPWHQAPHLTAAPGVPVRLQQEGLLAASLEAFREDLQLREVELEELLGQDIYIIYTAVLW